jgi:uncharacterized membrane protein YeaQ/YmgE (transglycosylase-associated protein family)
MVKSLQRLTVSFTLYVALIATMAATMPREQPRSILGFLLPFAFLVLFLGFGGAFVAAFSRSPLLPSRPILRFIVPIVGGAAVLILASFIGSLLGAFIRDHVL